MSSIYDEPEKFGLALVREWDAGEDDEYDVVAIWRDELGNLYAGTDDTCSCCADPFEDWKITDLTVVHTRADISEFANSAWNDLDDVERDEAVKGLLDGIKL